EFYFDQNAFISAIQRAVEYLTKFNNAPKRDLALYIIAESYRLEDNHEKARQWYEKLIDNFPESDYFSDAKEKISGLRKQ
ncbi:MAG: tetratricopeptide repeat protein, partial [Nitrospinae bacterium]|nr:tetratricopeptide repeat protein [Nitrospinota bacterium]